MLLQWDVNANEVAERIRNQQGFLKIVLKTFNEELFIEKWINHHANIVGLENLIIADNNSTNENVLTVYEKYKEICIFQFTGYHNIIHNIKKFHLLYDAIRCSCKYFLFIDTDEFLVFFDKSNKWSADNTILDNIKLLHNDPYPIIITVALHNIWNSEQLFLINIADGITWGKPLFPTDYIDKGMAMHNSQVPWYLLNKNPSYSNLFLLHLDKFSTSQRITTNKNKLIKRGLCTIDDDLDSILKKDWKNWNDKTAIRHVHEIQQCLQKQHENITYTNIPKGCLELLPTGDIEYASIDERSSVEAFLDNPELYIFPIINPTDIIAFLNRAIVLRNAGDYFSAEKIFRNGMEKYPDYLDQYNHPAFKKELMRMLLSKQQWQEASLLIPKRGDIGGEYWHEILFARAYTAINDVENAKLWWLKIIHREPLNEEAKKFFNKI